MIKELKIEVFTDEFEDYYYLKEYNKFFAVKNLIELMGKENFEKYKEDNDAVVSVRNQFMTNYWLFEFMINMKSRETDHLLSSLKKAYILVMKFIGKDKKINMKKTTVLTINTGD